MSLPLLEQERFPLGVAYVEEISRNFPQLTNFVGYLRRYWIPRQVSVYGAPQRTNNAVESFHRVLLRTTGRSHPNIWTLTEILQGMEHSKRVDFHRLEDGVVLPRRRASRYLRFDRQLERTRQVYQNDVGRFLRAISHSVDRLNRLFGENKTQDIM